MSELSDKAKMAQREYRRKWNAENRDKLREYRRKWYYANKEKHKESQRKYWEKVAEEMAKKGEL